MKKLIFIGVSFLFVITSCTPTEQGSLEEVNVENEVGEAILTEQLLDGFQLMQSTCFSCHSPNSLIETTAAPTLSVIKKGYLKKYPQENGFVDAFVAFLANPSKENAIIDGAVEQYGIMPQMSLQTNQAKAIALYLYSHPVEETTWFTTDFPKEEIRVLNRVEPLSYVDRGFEYAMATKALLGKNLKEKVNSEGTFAAVEFCNLNAYHYTDSMSTVYGAAIKRVTDQPRNPKNQANVTELKMIDAFKKQLQSGSEIIPQTIEEKNFVYGYYPIVTNDMCLKCHGAVNDLDEETYAKILDLYPKDQATGYLTNQLRGIWVVKMMK